jgi:predicted O-methyltransferase YrrM
MHITNIINYWRFIPRILIARRIANRSIERGALQKMSDLSMLIYVLGGRKLKSIVEIGTYKGGTLYMWLRLADPSATIIALDLKITDEAKKQKKSKKKNQRLFFLEKDSHKQTTRQDVLDILGHQEIDLLYIDGDHHYKSVKRDWQIYSPLVKKGGVIIFHDVAHPNCQICQVNRLWNEIKSLHDHIEIVMDTSIDRKFGKWGGFGVIFF